MVGDKYLMAVDFTPQHIFKCTPEAKHTDSDYAFVNLLYLKDEVHRIYCLANASLKWELTSSINLYFS